MYQLLQTEQAVQNRIWCWWLWATGIPCPDRCCHTNCVVLPSDTNLGAEWSGLDILRTTAWSYSLNRCVSCFILFLKMNTSIWYHVLLKHIKQQQPNVTKIKRLVAWSHWFHTGWFPCRGRRSSLVWDNHFSNKRWYIIKKAFVSSAPFLPKSTT